MKMLSVVDINQRFEQYGIVCQSITRKSPNDRLSWKCTASDHAWEATYYDVIKQIEKFNGCRRCFRDTPEGRVFHTLEELQEVAKERGGELLSKEYKNCDEKLLWQCYYKHTWEAKTTSILQGKWCPYCKTSVAENVCRAYFEQLLGEKFVKQKPSWLKGELGRLELDGFCEKLEVAFEHHGKQHYNYVPHFHRKKEDFDKQIARDALKKKLCDENGVTLLIIPDLFTKTSVDDLRKIICNFAKERLLTIDLEKKVELTAAYTYSEFNEIKKICKELQIECYLQTTRMLMVSYFLDVVSPMFGKQNQDGLKIDGIAQSVSGQLLLILIVLDFMKI